MKKILFSLFAAVAVVTGMYGQSKMYNNIMVRMEVEDLGPIIVVKRDIVLKKDLFGFGDLEEITFFGFYDSSTREQSFEKACTFVESTQKFYESTEPGKDISANMLTAQDKTGHLEECFYIIRPKKEQKYSVKIYNGFVKFLIVSLCKKQASSNNMAANIDNKVFDIQFSEINKKYFSERKLIDTIKISIGDDPMEHILTESVKNLVSKILSDLQSPAKVSNQNEPQKPGFFSELTTSAKKLCNKTTLAIMGMWIPPVIVIAVTTLLLKEPRLLSDSNTRLAILGTTGVSVATMFGMLKLFEKQLIV